MSPMSTMENGRGLSPENANLMVDGLRLLRAKAELRGETMKLSRIEAFSWTEPGSLVGIEAVELLLEERDADFRRTGIGAGEVVRIETLLEELRA